MRIMATMMQKRAVEEIVVKGSNISKAMKVAGYSESACKRTNKLTETNGFKELMEKYLPDTLILQKHKELLTVSKKIRTYRKGELEIETEELDTQAISKGVDMAYKLKGSYAAEKHEVTIPKPIIDVD